MSRLTSAQMAALAEKHKPVIYLNTCEPYLPIDFVDYLQEARLKNSKTGAVFRPEAKFNAEVLGAWLTQYPEINNQVYTLFLPEGMQSTIVNDYHPDDQALQQVPLYVHSRVVPHKNAHRDEDIFMSFAHLYAFNGSQPLCCCADWKTGAHFADLEHVTARLMLTKRGSVSLEQVYMSRHNGGVWLQPHDVTFEGDHPVVFSAEYGHASYNTPGAHARYWGVVKDRCDHGSRWLSERLLTIQDDLEDNPPDLKWALFQGNLGDGHVSGFPRHTFWFQLELTQNYGNGCAPWKWRF